MAEVDLTIIRSQPSLTSALMLCQQLSGVEDKELVGPRGIVKDVAQWSRIRGGQHFFPQERLIAFMDVCGNEAPLIWLADRRGYRLERLESELERQLRLEREKNEKLAGENALLRDLVQGRAK
jgi:hypothetical protein